jgi:nucleotide-binding universal stress UspA family protein
MMQNQRNRTKGAQQMYKSILVPLDGSARAEAILPHAEVLARTMGAKLILLRVIEPSEVGISGRDTGSPFVVSQLEERFEQAQSYLQRMQIALQVHQIETKVLVDQGPIVAKIIEVAGNEGVDLIAMASHGRTGLGRVFYGSVAAGVLNRADRPLLLVRAQA